MGACHGCAKLVCDACKVRLDRDEVTVVRVEQLRADVERLTRERDEARVLLTSMTINSDRHRDRADRAESALAKAEADAGAMRKTLQWYAVDGHQGGPNEGRIVLGMSHYDYDIGHRAKECLAATDAGARLLARLERLERFVEAWDKQREMRGTYYFDQASDALRDAREAIRKVDT